MSLATGSGYANAPAPAPYAAAGPSYGPPQSYGAPPAPLPTPVPLTPLIVTGDTLLAEEAPTGKEKSLMKLIIVPLAIILPLAIGIPLIYHFFFGKKKKQGFTLFEETTPFFDQSTTETPSTTEYGTPGYPGRRRRDADSSGLPSLSIAQVERLTEVVFAAMRSQECIQRLVCELGAMSKTYSDTAHSVAKAVEQFVPPSIKDSYEVFANPEKCEQYRCGSLQVKK